ncbi:unnamed protein product, partial [Gulo gulo]
ELWTLPLVSAEPECGRGPQLPDSLCRTPVPAPAPLLCGLRLPLPLHVCQLWRPLLHRALSGHPPGDQVPEVDCVSLGVPGGEGLRASPQPQRGLGQRERCPSRPREQLFTCPAEPCPNCRGRAVFPGLCAAKWAGPSACCCV